MAGWARHSATTGLLLLALLTATPAGVHAYSHNAVLWGAQRSPLSIELHAAGVDALSVEDLEGVLRSTIAEWNSVPCAWLEMEYGGQTEDHVAVDGRQIIEWIEDEDAWVYGSMSAGATISVVYDDPDTPEREEPRVDIAFNGVDFEWRIGGSEVWDGTVLDPEAVLTHEIGHLLGLAHARDDNAATMGPAYLPDLSQRSLGLDDKIGLCEKYWLEQGECDDVQRCPDGEACTPYASEAHGGAVQLCEEPHGTFGDRCSIEHLHCRGMCMFLRLDLSLGYCTDRCVEEQDCPGDFSCDEVPVGEDVLLFCRNAAIEERGFDDPDLGAPVDGGAGDGGARDVGEPDGGHAGDAGRADSGDARDLGPEDAGVDPDQGAPDAAQPAPDAGPAEAPDLAREPPPDAGVDAGTAPPDGAEGIETDDDGEGCGACALPPPPGRRSGLSVAVRWLLRAGLVRQR